jgi:membrane fusion protein (multidrug efflux system)
VDVGDWNGDDWFVDQGLDNGDTVIVDGTLRLTPGAAVKATPYVAPPRPQRKPKPAAPPSATIVAPPGAAQAPGNATARPASAKPAG